MKRLLAILLLGASFNCAFAQNPVVTNPSKRTAVVSGNTIGVTGTFQSIFAANINRLGCVIQNNGIHNMQVDFVSKATATISTSAVVPPGGTAGCDLYGTVITGEVSVTGTTGDWFYASQY